MKKLVPIFLIFFLVIFLFLPYFFPPQDQMLYGGDIYDAYYYWKGYLRDSILTGTLPFWNPYNFSGTPFLAHPNVNIFYPLNWIFILFPLEQSFTFYMFVHMIIAGVTMYWLGRQYTDRYGALFCAICYCLGAYFSARIYAGHPEYIDTAAWIPLAFGLTRQALLNHAKKLLIFAILGMGLLFLSGNELFILYTLEILSLYIFYLFFTAKKRTVFFILKNFGLLFIIVSFSLGIAAIEVLPRLEFLRLSLRSQGVPYSMAGSGSLSFEGLKLFFHPFVFGMPGNYLGAWPNLSEYLYYIGILPLLLIGGFILLTVWKKLVRHKKTIFIHADIWFFLFIVVPIFTLISLGVYSPINVHELLWKYIPFYQSYRFPARHLFVVFFSLSLVSGIVLGTIKSRFIKVVCIFILAFELLSIDIHFFRLTDIPTKTFDNKLVERLSDAKNIYRVLPDFSVVSGVRRDVDFGSSSVYKFDSTSDYNSMILSDYYRFIDLINQSRLSSTQFYNVEIPPLHPSSPYIDFLNIRYVLADKSADTMVGDSGSYSLVSEGERYRLYENTRYMSRFFLVNAAKIYPTRLALEDDILSRSVDFSKSVALVREDIGDAKKFDLGCSRDNGTVRVLSYTANAIQLSTVSPCNSFLTTSEVYYPGWKVMIDGKTVPLYRSNYAFRAMYVPKGEHIVEIYYFPQIYIVGFILSVLSILGLIILYKKK